MVTVRNICGDEYVQNHNIITNNKIFYLQLFCAFLPLTFNIDLLTRA